MTDDPDKPEPSERERFYDDVVAPKLAEVAELCHSQGMSIIATVEFEPNGIGTTMKGIGRESSIEMKLLQLLSFCRGNIDSFFLQCMKRFDMSQTLIGSFMRKMEAEQELRRINKGVSDAARDEDPTQADGMGDPRAEHAHDEGPRAGPSQRGRGAMGPRPGAKGDTR